LTCFVHQRRVGLPNCDHLVPLSEPRTGFSWIAHHVDDSPPTIRSWRPMTRSLSSFGLWKGPRMCGCSACAWSRLHMGQPSDVPSRRAGVAEPAIPGPPKRSQEAPPGLVAGISGIRLRPAIRDPRGWAGHAFRGCRRDTSGPARLDFVGVLPDWRPCVLADARHPCRTLSP
jgi:hypothetical protein